MDAPGTREATGWNRPAGWPALIGVSLLTALGWLALMVLVFFHVRQEWITVIEVREQALDLQLPVGLQASASIDRPVSTRVVSDSLLPLQIDQQVRVQLPPTLMTQGRVKVVVPVDARLDIDAAIPLDTELTVPVSLHRWLPDFTVQVPVRTSLPLRLSVPVRVDVPVTLDVSARVSLPQVLDLPLKARWQVPVRIDQPIEARLTRDTVFSLEAPVPELAVVLARARLEIPMRQFGWIVKDVAP